MGRVCKYMFCGFFSGELSKLSVPNYLTLKVIVTKSVLKTCVMRFVYTKQIVIHLGNTGVFTTMIYF